MGSISKILLPSSIRSIFTIENKYSSCQCILCILQKHFHSSIGRPPARGRSGRDQRHRTPVRRDPDRRLSRTGCGDRAGSGVPHDGAPEAGRHVGRVAYSGSGDGAGWVYRWPQARSRGSPGGTVAALEHRPRRRTDQPPENDQAQHVRAGRVRSAAPAHPGGRIKLKNSNDIRYLRVRQSALR